MKTLTTLIILIISLFSVASCSNSNSEVEDSDSYSVAGQIASDSASVDTDLKLFIDKHGSLVEETLPVLKGKFAYKGKTEAVDELFLIDDKGRAIKFFAHAGSHIELNIDQSGSPSFGNRDSLNLLYHQLVSEFEACSQSNRSQYLDSVCQLYRHSLAPALLIRDRMQLLNDSVHLRQCLGRISEAAKPSWLSDDLEERFDKSGLRLVKNSRLAPLSKFRTDIDTLFVNFNETRQNAMYVYFWADYNQPSVDSLQMLTPLARYYGLHEYLDEYVKTEKSRRPKRVDILTICLHAADSATWRKSIEGLPGRHVLLQSGFSHSTIKSWKVTTVPYNIIVDRFSNVLDSYLWGQDLREAIDKTPSNFSVTLNGSKNNNRRITRH